MKSAKILAIFLSTVGLIWAQAETGQITGTVLDPAGSTVPNAAITATSTSTGAERTTTSSGTGAYTFANLLPDEYDVKVQAQGFTTFEQKVQLTVGGKVGLDARLTLGQSSTTVQVSESSVMVDTESQTLATNISQNQLRELPTLTRDPYDLVALSGNVSDAQPMAATPVRGVGFSVNGQRASSTDILLDGAENTNAYDTTVGQSVPLDSVLELSVLTNNFTAEFGRASGGVINVVTKSGTNSFHGTAYEFNRVSALATNSYQNNALGVTKSVFTRNQFGYSVGGPIKKDKLFFFSSTEWTRIRSIAVDDALVPTTQFLSLTAPNTQNFFNTYGKLKSSDSVLGSYSANGFANSGVNLCGTNAACNAINPNLPLFNLVSYNVAGDAGGGSPLNGYSNVNRVDYNFSDKTQIYGRYALESKDYSAGFVSSSPYSGYDTGQTNFNNNALVSVTHVFNPSLTSQSKAVFNRLNEAQPFGSYPAVPTLYTGSSGELSLLGYSVTFPGYEPLTPGGGIPFGGPQNYVQLYEDLTWNKGAHDIRFGGSFDYIRDNRTFGAYETAGEYLGPGVGSSEGMVGGLLSGSLYEFQTAIYPQGKYPGDAVSYPLTQPNFSRSNRFKEGAVYVQDNWKVKPTFTANIGLRWEHFGVQQNKNPNLDSNFYDPTNEVDTPLGIRLGSISPVPTSSEGALWKPDWHDFAPRLGFAWDVTGDGKTALRGGYGISYERNFGNVTFNVIQNPPNYETVQLLGGGIPISSSNLGPFSASTGTLTLPKASARNVDYNIQTAYAHFWSATLEHKFGHGLVVGADYSGSRGVHLYDIGADNQPGYGNVFLGDPCPTAVSDVLSNGSSSCLTTLNSQFSGINRRGSHGWSLYNSATLRSSLNNVANSGVTLTFNYTWSHAEDNLSSTFSDADSFAANNGEFNLGYIDPYEPMLDKGSSDFDIRQRVSISAVWAIPAFKNSKGLVRQLFGGWEVTPLFSARTGSPYSIFDETYASYNAPRAGFLGPVSDSANTNAQPVAGIPNTFAYLSIPNSLVDHFYNPVWGYSNLPPFPADMSGRNTFRAPGFWNMNVGLYKDFALSERFKMQLRGESYNLMNHANMYVNGAGAEVSSVDPTAPGDFTITSCKGCSGLTQDRRNIQLALKLTF